MAKSSKRPERPRAEPEIIPPDRSRDAGSRRPDWPPYTQSYGTHRIHVGRIGPIGFALVMLVVGLIAGILLLALIGAALVWIPIVAAIAIVAMISGVFRRR
jgi:hypothetical protein